MIERQIIGSFGIDVDTSSHIPILPIFVNSRNPSYSKAQALRTELAVGQLEPAIILLTHCYWGADLLQATRHTGIRALFVQYPGKEIPPPFAHLCEHWETVQHDQINAVVAALGKLIG